MAATNDTFSLTITMGNEAMLTSEDVADALRVVVRSLDNGADHGAIMDANGNSVGSWELPQ